MSKDRENFHELTDLKNYIKSYRNFPTQGIVFLDVLGILQEPELFNELVLKMSETKIISEAQAIISIDARGFIFGTAISLITSKPMIVARKKGKLPGELVSKKYELEYGKESLDAQSEAIAKYESFAIVDDVLATGGTAECVNQILEECNKKVMGLVVVIEIGKLKGREKFPLEVSSQITY